MAGELFCNWKPNDSLGFEGTRKALFRYQAKKKRSKLRRTNMPVVCGRQQVTKKKGSHTSFTAKQMQYIRELP